MKILELTNFSAGICGVWQRVKQESELLSKNHEVVVMSSNKTKGSDEITPPTERIGQVEIFRFSAKKLGGESFLKWDFEKAALKFNPEVIIAHSYRQLHTTKALEIAKKLRGTRVFLVTHAPFIEGNRTRSKAAAIAVTLYDKIFGPTTINKFDKVIAISKWELPYLRRLGVKREKLIYIPNGIPEEFFKQKKSKEQDKILFLGRISPIKNLEVLIKAMGLIRDKKIILEIVGPSEEDYLSKLMNLVKEEKLGRRINFLEPIYNVEEKIKKMDSSKIFLLPSKREAMPQAMIEVMSRGKAIIVSRCPGTLDLIKDGEDGMLFSSDNPKELAEKINLILEDKKLKKEMEKNAKKSSQKFRWKELIKKLEDLL